MENLTTDYTDKRRRIEVICLNVAVIGLGACQNGEPDLLARKEAKGELVFGMALSKWFQLALPTNRVGVLEITTEIAIDATRLPGWSHKDPADQIIVATARLHGLKILTSASKILEYRHVTSIASRKA